MGPPLRPVGAPDPTPGWRGAIPYVGLSAWLLGGYFLLIALVGHLPWTDALWRAAICLVAIAPLLELVIGAIALLKRASSGVPPGLVGMLWGIGNAVQFLLPWLGWSAALWASGIAGSPALVVGAAVALFSYATGAAALAVFHPRATSVRLTHIEVPLGGLPPAFDGYRILHISDIHAGPFASARSIASRLARACGHPVDLVAFTGDLATTRAAVRMGAAAAAQSITATDGAIAVLGNHDRWIGGDYVRAALAEYGVKVLVNEHTTVSRGDAALYVAGVDDASYTRFDDLGAALKGIPAGAPIILLSHTPDIVLDPHAARASLILTGHTHGGQVVLPWLGPIYVPSRLGRRWAAGLYDLGGRWLFVTRGLGEIFPPIRINCPPEIGVITLRRRAPEV